MKADKEPTFTYTVETWLAEQDDFKSFTEIRLGTGLSYNRVSAALSNARKFKAADFMVQDGITYWFLTPESDTRIRHVEEKAREDNPRKPRRVKGSTNPGAGRGVRPREGDQGS